MNKKMYVIVRNDLAVSYKMVQGAHALAQMALIHSKDFEEWNNGTVIFVAVPNLKELKKLQDNLHYVSKKVCIAWHEIDLECQLTALCYYGDGIILEHLPLA